MGEQMCRLYSMANSMFVQYGTSLPRSLTWFCLLLLTTSASNGQRIEPGCRELVDIDVGLAACAKTSMRGAACMLVEVSAETDELGLGGCYVPTGTSDHLRPLYRRYDDGGPSEERYLYAAARVLLMYAVLASAWPVS